MQQQEKDDVSHRGDVIGCVVCLTEVGPFVARIGLVVDRDEQVCDGLGYR